MDIQGVPKLNDKLQWSDMIDSNRYSKDKDKDKKKHSTLTDTKKKRERCCNYSQT